MINTKNTSIDTILNRKKNIMNIIFKDINYNSKKIKYDKPYVYKIKTHKIKTENFIRNVNNLEKKKICDSFNDDKDISVKDVIADTNSNSNYMILPNNKIHKDMYGVPVQNVDGVIGRYNKDIFLYKYDDKSEEEPDIDELLKIISKEIDDMKEDMSYLTKMYDSFLNNPNTKEEYKSYKDGTTTNPYIKNKYVYKVIDEPIQEIIQKYKDLINNSNL